MCWAVILRNTATPYRREPSSPKTRSAARPPNGTTLYLSLIHICCICHETNHLDGVTIMDLAEFFYEDQEHDDEDESATEE